MLKSIFAVTGASIIGLLALSAVVGSNPSPEAAVQLESGQIAQASKEAPRQRLSPEQKATAIRNLAQMVEIGMTVEEVQEKIPQIRGSKSVNSFGGVRYEYLTFGVWSEDGYVAIQLTVKDGLVADYMMMGL